MSVNFFFQCDFCHEPKAQPWSIEMFCFWSQNVSDINEIKNIGEWKLLKRAADYLLAHSLYIGKFVFVYYVKWFFHLLSLYILFSSSILSTLNITCKSLENFSFDGNAIRDWKMWLLWVWQFFFSHFVCLLKISFTSVRLSHLSKF